MPNGETSNSKVQPKPIPEPPESDPPPPSKSEDEPTKYEEEGVEEDAEKKPARDRLGKRFWVCIKPKTPL